MSERPKFFPVQRDNLSSIRGAARLYVPWHIGVEAWQSYATRYKGQSAERIAERGGFGESEMDVYRPGWRAYASSE
jgi:hypothetical protein